jgi:hypothetical protein
MSSDLDYYYLRRKTRPIRENCVECGAPLSPRQKRVRNLTCGLGCRDKAKIRARADRFWARVQKGPGCWLWQGAKNQRGYGLAYYDGKKNQTVHRLMWRLHFGEIPEGKLVCHTCDTPSCVNPEHLFLGTNQDNSDDKIAKGRYKHGIKRMTPEQVREIRALKASGLTYLEIQARGYQDYAWESIYQAATGVTHANVV